MTKNQIYTLTNGTMQWTMHNECFPAMLGFLPEMLNPADPQPAKEQLHEAYTHGGGWNKFEGFAMLANGELKYPGDPPVKIMGETTLRNERVIVYEHAWVAIVQPDGKFEVARMD